MCRGSEIACNLESSAFLLPWKPYIRVILMQLINPGHTYQVVDNVDREVVYYYKRSHIEQALQFWVTVRELSV